MLVVQTVRELRIGTKIPDNTNAHPKYSEIEQVILEPEVIIAPKPLLIVRIHLNGIVPYNREHISRVIADQVPGLLTDLQQQLCRCHQVSF